MTNESKIPYHSHNNTYSHNSMFVVNIRKHSPYVSRNNASTVNACRSLMHEFYPIFFNMHTLFWPDSWDDGGTNYSLQTYFLFIQLTFNNQYTLFLILCGPYLNSNSLHHEPNSLSWPSTETTFSVASEPSDWAEDLQQKWLILWLLIKLDRCINICTAILFPFHCGWLKSWN